MNDILTLLRELIQYNFILKALLVGCFVALSCSFIGVFLVLKRLSLIGDGLAHIAFASVSLSLLLSSSPLFFSVPISVFSSILILRLTKTTQISGDSAIGLVSATAVAVGVLIASMGKGFNVDLFSYLFGNILIIENVDVIISIAISIFVLVIILLHYNSIFAVIYDEDFAITMGIKVNTINYIIAILTAITVVVGIHVVGIMLISSMIIFPAVTALQMGKGFKQTILISSIISVGSVIVGIFISLIIDTPTGATIVLLNAIIFAFILFIKSLK